MTPDELGIEGLAEYLHLDPAQVARLADRGKLPGRKVGGHWRFARTEINQWLERRIGASTEDELLQMEDMLSRNPALPPNQTSQSPSCSPSRPSPPPWWPKPADR